MYPGARAQLRFDPPDQATPARLRWWAIAGTAVLAALILTLDLIATGVGIGTLYLVPLLLISSVGSPQSIVYASLLMSALVVVGLLKFPIAEVPWTAYASGGIELSVLWTAALMLSRLRSIGLRLESRTRELADVSYALNQSAIVAATDTKGTITFANDKFCEISKYAREELLGHDHRIINSGYHSKEFMRDLWHTIANGRIWHGEIRNRAKDGTLYWVDTTIVPFLNQRGKPYQYMSIRFEITERKLAEEHLREQTALARLGEMAAVVAHEVKNPIAGIRGALQVITSRMAAEQGDRVILVDIVARLDALNRIVEDMLLFARPRPLRQEPIALSSLVGDAAAMIRLDPGLAGLDIQVEGSAAVIGDTELFQIVFQNILVNAAQAMGGRGRIDVTISESGGLCEIAFADRGPGMPLEVREKAFDAFYTTKHRGTGLGLPIARRVVETHGGRISIELPPSGGTTLRIQLPAAS